MPLTTPATVVGMVTAALWRRWNINPSTPLLILPTELLPHNGRRLQNAVMDQARAWHLAEGFLSWISEMVSFLNTLVDRIVTGPPDPPGDWWEKLSYQDNYLTVGEHYGRWWIEASEGLANMPLERVSTVQFVDRLERLLPVENIGTKRSLIEDFLNVLRHRFKQEWLHHRLEDIAVRLADKWWIRVAPGLDW